MKDIYIYCKQGGAWQELEKAIKIGNFEKYGYKIIYNNQTSNIIAPKGSNCFFIGDHETFKLLLSQIEGKKVLYLMESLPYKDNLGTIYYGNNFIKDMYKNFLGEINSYNHIVFMDGGVRNYFISENPTWSSKSNIYFIGFSSAFKIKTQYGAEEYNFLHFGWTPKEGRRIGYLENLKEFNIYPLYQCYAEEREKGFNTSKYILCINHLYQPGVNMPRFIFSVINDMPIFMEQAICEPFTNLIIPNEDFIELPYGKGIEMKERIREVLNNNEVDKIKNNIKRFKNEEWSIPYRLSKLFDEIF